MPYNSIKDDLLSEDPIVEWILPEFIPKQTLITLGGMPGVGKSYLSYTLGLGLAAGIPVLGHTPSRPFKVVYFDEENSKPDRLQYEKWAWEGLGRPDLDMLAENYWRFPFLLGDSAWPENMASVLREVQPDLFIVDTATPALNIKDENDNGEASKAIERLRVCMNISNATCLVLKHAKVANDNGSEHTLRGAKAWMSMVDAVMFQLLEPGRQRQDGLRNTQIKPHKTRAFGLRRTLHIKPMDGRLTHHGISLDAQF